VPGWFARHAFLAETDDEQLLGTVLKVAPGVVLEQTAEPGGEGWTRPTRGCGRPAACTAPARSTRWASPGRRGGRRPAARRAARPDRRAVRDRAGRAANSGALDAVRALIEEGFLTAD
jgi:hypothetical protein